MFVIAEVHTLVLRWRDARAARRFLEAAVESGAHTIAPVDAELVEAAVARWIRGYADQSFSLCDAISFEVMRRERIATALTYDQHFAVVGFEILR
jgi:predicted nucleic acid-binding protein